MPMPMSRTNIAPLYIQVCRLAGNLCFGGAYNWFNFVDLFVNVALTAEDATSFRWAAHAIWNACTHSTSTREVIDSNWAVESLVKGASRFLALRARTASAR